MGRNRGNRELYFVIVYRGMAGLDDGDEGDSSLVGCFVACLRKFSKCSGTWQEPELWIVDTFLWYVVCT